MEHSPERAFMEGREILAKLKTIHESHTYLQYEVWSHDIQSLESWSFPKTLIALCGATGAGKSSLLNAVLGDNIVPTSGMQACTATVTEVSYHSGPGVKATVEFLTLENWREEIGFLLSDVQDNRKKALSDPASVGGVAWQKIHVVYPNIKFADLEGVSVEKILASNEDISTLLEKGSLELHAETASEFRDLCSKYIQSAPNKLGVSGKVDGALWPLVRRIHIRCSSPALSSGTTIVDLPGLEDTNTARSAVALGYLEKCDHICIVASTLRAVNDKIAKDLLGKARNTIMRNGRFKNVEESLTFVVTKCDDVDHGELIENMGLHDDPDYMHIMEVHRSRCLNIDVDGIVENGLVDTGISGNPGQSASSEKEPGNHKRPLPNSDPSDASDAEAALKRIKLDQEPGALHYKLHSNNRETEGQARALSRDLKAFCSRRRSEYAITRLQEDFRIGLQDFDDEEMEKTNPDDLDPDKGIRGQSRDNEEATCFRESADTGIPALVQRYHDITATIHKRAVCEFVTRLHQLSLQMKDKVEGKGEVQGGSSIDLKTIWTTGRGQKDGSAVLSGKDFTQQLQEALLRKSNQCADGIKKELKAKIENVNRKALKNGTINLPDEVNAFTNNMHHAKLRAVLKRHGSYGVDNNLNLRLASLFSIKTNPVTENFFKNAFTPYVEVRLTDTISKILEDFKNAASPTFQARISGQTIKETAKSKEMVKLVVARSGSVILNKLTSTAMILEPVIQGALCATYSDAHQVTGKGCLAKQKVIMHDYMKKNVNEIFETVETHLGSCIDDACRQVFKDLNVRLQRIPERIRIGMSVLWDVQDTQQEQDERKLVLKEMNQLFSRTDSLVRQQSTLLSRTESPSE